MVVASILEKTLESALQFEDPGLDNLVDALLSLLDKDVPENVKNCAQYFGLFSNFTQRVMKEPDAEQHTAAHSGVSSAELQLESSSFLVQGSGPCQLLLKHSAYRRMLVFLLGSNRQNNPVKQFAFQMFPMFLERSNVVLFFWFLKCRVCFNRTAAGAQPRPASSCTSTALWPSSRCNVTSAHSGRTVRDGAQAE